MSDKTPHDFLVTAIEMFSSQAEFTRAIAESSNRHITPVMVSVWKRRGKGAPDYVCPDIEALTGIPCESLRPEVHWHIVANRWMRAVAMQSAVSAPVTSVPVLRGEPLRRRPAAKLRQSRAGFGNDLGVHDKSISAG